MKEWKKGDYNIVKPNKRIGKKAKLKKAKNWKNIKMLNN